jgi:hypothetical protein
MLRRLVFPKWFEATRFCRKPYWEKFKIVLVFTATDQINSRRRHWRTSLRNREEKKPLGILMRRVEDNIKMERKEIKRTFVDQILLVQDTSGDLFICKR